MKNKYKGKCFKCGSEVKERQGYFQRKDGKWVVRCKNCVGKGN
jgi:hypothetical protein